MSIKFFENYDSASKHHEEVGGYLINYFCSEAGKQGYQVLTEDYADLERRYSKEVWRAADWDETKIGLIPSKINIYTAGQVVTNNNNSR